MTVEDEKIMIQYEQELARANQNSQNSNPYAQSFYGGQNKQNLIEYELDFKTELELIERNLRCDMLFRDKDGNEYWVKNPNSELICFNEVGVNDILRQVLMLVNKHKILSNYTIEEIKQRLKMFGHEIRILIYVNYEKYGIDNEYKMTNYPILVLDILSTIEDAYRRALGGEAHRGLGEQRIVTQNETVGGMGGYPQMMMPKKEKSIWNPLSWGR